MWVTGREGEGKGADVIECRHSQVPIERILGIRAFNLEKLLADDPLFLDDGPHGHHHDHAHGEDHAHAHGEHGDHAHGEEHGEHAHKRHKKHGEEGHACDVACHEHPDHKHDDSCGEGLVRGQPGFSQGLVDV